MKNHNDMTDEELAMDASRQLEVRGRSQVRRFQEEVPMFFYGWNDLALPMTQERLKRRWMEMALRR